VRGTETMEFGAKVHCRRQTRFVAVGAEHVRYNTCKIHNSSGILLFTINVPLLKLYASII